MKKKNILFLANSYKNYMGGIYYIKNMAYALTQCDEARDAYNIFILVAKDSAYVYEHLLKEPNVHLIYTNMESKINAIKYKVMSYYYFLKTGKSITNGLDSKVVKKNKIDIIFPLYEDCRFQNKGILWIPDFQHLHYPEFFPKDKLKEREESYDKYIRLAKTIVLSSKDAYCDYTDRFGSLNKDVFIVPFVSEISEYRNIDLLRKKYKLPEKFFIVSNQFYSHKNHIVVFKALAEAKARGYNDITIVCTGLMEDNRNPQYIDELNKIIKKYELKINLLILGLIPREDQLGLIKGSVIQPSLFEGWSTVVEDAKSLRQNLVLSDIDVHFEQRLDNCIFFKRNDYLELAEILIGIWSGSIKFKVSGYRYEEYAKDYGKRFFDAIESR